MDPNFKRLLSELCKKLPQLLDEEQIEYHTYSNRISFSCPIHGSDKSESACVFTEESRLGLIGNWKCFTHGCEDQVGKSVYSLLKEYYCIANNWSKKQSDEHVRSLVTFDKVKYNVENDDFIRQVKILQKPIIDFEKTFDRWANSVDYEDKIPHTKNGIHRLLETVNSLVKCTKCTDWGEQSDFTKRHNKYYCGDCYNRHFVKHKKK